MERKVRSYIFFQLKFLQEAGFPLSGRVSWRIEAEKRDPCEVTILFVPVRVRPDQLGTGCAEDCDETILRHCPVCDSESIIGHGRRRKQAHDEYHDWIEIRRGRCVKCGKTFTFLPLLSLPYTHYSLLARCQALLRHFVEHCSWEKAVPKFKDSDRSPDPSTLCRWSSGLDTSQPSLSFLRQTVARVAHWLALSEQPQDEAVHCRLAPVFETLLPLRL